jgi:hypothetical protein
VVRRDHDGGRSDTPDFPRLLRHVHGSVPEGDGMIAGRLELPRIVVAGVLLALYLLLTVM